MRVSVVLATIALLVCSVLMVSGNSDVTNDEAEFESQSMERLGHQTSVHQQHQETTSQGQGFEQQAASSSAQHVSLAASPPLNAYGRVPVSYHVRATILSAHEFDNHPIFEHLSPSLKPVRPLDSSKHYVKPVILDRHPKHYHQYVARMHHAHQDDAEDYVLPHHHVDDGHEELDLPNLPPAGFEPEYFDELDHHPRHHEDDEDEEDVHEERSRRRRNRSRSRRHKKIIDDAEQDVQEMLSRHKPRRADEDADLFEGLNLDKKKHENKNPDQANDQSGAGISDAALNAVRTQVATRLKQKATELLDYRLQEVSKHIEEKAARSANKVAKKTKAFVSKAIKKQMNIRVHAALDPLIQRLEKRIMDGLRRPRLV